LVVQEVIPRLRIADFYPFGLQTPQAKIGTIVTPAAAQIQDPGAPRKLRHKALQMAVDRKHIRLEFIFIMEVARNMAPYQGPVFVHKTEEIRF
jgi:hypothetical protein